MPRGKKFTAERIIGKLRAAVVELARGKTAAVVRSESPRRCGNACLSATRSSGRSSIRESRSMKPLTAE